MAKKQEERSEIPGGLGSLQDRRAEVANIAGEAEQHGVDPEEALKWLSDLERDAPPDKEIEVVMVIRRRAGTNRAPPVDDYCRVDGPRPRHVSRADYAKRFGSDEADVKDVFEFVRQAGLRVIDDIGNQVTDIDAPGFMQSCTMRRMMRVGGTQKDMDLAFGINTKHVTISGAVHRVHAESVTVPDTLEGIVVWVFGLETQNVPRSVQQMAALTASRHDLGKAKIRPMRAPVLAELYKYPSTLDGAGQCIGILEPNGGFTEDDMTAFFEAMKIPKPDIVAVGNNDASWYEGRGLTIFNMEVALDVQVAAALAPGAKTAVYMPGRCGAANDAFPKRLYEVLSNALFDDKNRPSVLSLSWGGPELTWKDGDRQQIDELLRDAVCLGVTVCASSGDSGAAPPNPNAGIQTPPVCVYPASSPHVLACGGTSLEDYEEDTQRYNKEVVWNDHSTILEVEFSNSQGGTVSRNGGGASGGGVSECYPVPEFQKEARVPQKTILGWKNGRVKVGDPIIGRGVPDVAANADLHTGYEIRFNGELALGGGSSAAAPVWAALIARINQGLDDDLGYFNPVLYELQLGEGSGVCREITEGNNGGYDARPGWNACTGLGRPRGSAMLNALQARARQQASEKQA